MTDRLGNILGGIVRKNAQTAITRTPRSGSGNTLPPAPVLSPIVNAGRSAGSAARQSAAAALPAQSFAPPPPQLSLADAIGRSAGSTASNPVPMPSVTGTSIRMPSTSFSTLGESAIRTARTGGQEWGVYDVGGVNVAMPSALARRNNLSLTDGASVITDPQAVENMRNNHISYLNMPEEVTSKIQMPDDFGDVKLGKSISEQYARLKRDSAGDADPERVAKLTEFATAATEGAMKQAATISSDEWQAEHEYALVSNKQTGTTELVRRRELRSWPDDSYEIITNNVSVQEAQSIWDSGVLDGTGSQPTVDSTTATAQFSEAQARDAARYIEEMRNRGDVVEIDGKLYPAGTEEPVTATVRIDKPNETDLPEPPEGYVWVIDQSDTATDIMGMLLPLIPGSDLQADMDVRLAPVRRDRSGNIVVPDGTTILNNPDGDQPSMLGTSERGGNWLGDLWESTTGGVGNFWGWVKTRGREDIPGVSRAMDWWDDNVQDPITFIINSNAGVDAIRDIPIIGPPLAWLVENPDTNRAINTILEDPGEGLFLTIAAPQQMAVGRMIDAKRKEMNGEGGGTDAAWGAVFKSLPLASGIPEWMEKNPEKVEELYTDGYDIDDDGNPDLFGADAVYEYYLDNETPSGITGVVVRLAVETVTDPLTWAAVSGVAGRGVRGVGRNMRLSPEAGTATRAAGRVIEGTGRVIETGSRIAEDIGDLGARYALNTIGRIGAKINPVVSTARGTAHLRSVDALTSETINASAAGSGIGTLAIDGETGNLVLRISEENATTTGPGTGETTTRTVDPAELEAQWREANDIQQGDVVQTDNGPATRTDDGWEVTFEDGQVVESPLLSEIPQRIESEVPSGSGQTPARWQQQPIQPNQPVRYIDGMRKNALYEPLKADIEAQWLDSTEAQAANGKGLATVPHLNVSDSAAWMTIEKAQEIDPTYSRQWERNTNLKQNEHSATYALSEVVRRGSNDVAVRYWGAMTGDGSVVPLNQLGWAYEATTPVASVAPVPKNIRSRSNPRVVQANTGVDTIYARLRWHPETIGDPQFRQIIEDAVALDHDLRQRGLRSSGLDANGETWAFPRIATLIPEDAPITIPDDIRAAGEYSPSPMRTEDVSPGDLLYSEYLDRNQAVEMHVYQSIKETVPPVWVEDGTTRIPDAATSDFWVTATVDVLDGEMFRVYSPAPVDASIMARETSLARGYTTGEDPGGLVLEPRDHVARVEGEQAATAPDAPQEAAGSPQSVAEPEVGSIPEAAPPAQPGASDASLATRLRQLLDEVEGVEPEGTVPTETVSSTPTRTVAEVFEAEQSRATQRTETSARTSGTDPVPGGKMPEVTGETMTDPTGTVDMPVYRQADTPPVTEATASPPAQKLLDDILDLPEDSPRLRQLEAQSGKPTAATHKLLERDYSSATSAGDQYWLNRAIEPWENEILTRHPFPDGETYKDRVTRYFVEEGNKAGWSGVPDEHVRNAIKRAFAEYEAHLWENVPEFQRGVLSNRTKGRIKKLPAPIQKALSALATVARIPLRVFDRYSQWMRQRILFHPLKVLHYPSVQYFGNHVLNMLAGDWRVVRYMSNPANIGRAYRHIKSGNSAGWLRDGGPMTGSQRMNSRLGIESAPQTKDILRGRAVGTEGDHMIGGKLLTEKLGKTGEGVSFFVAGSKFARDFGAAMDLVYREAIEVSSMTRHSKRVMPDFRNAQINRMVSDWGISMEDARSLWKGFEDSLGNRWEFSPADVQRYFSREFNTRGMASAKDARGRAIRMSRDWRETVKRGQKYTEEQIKYRAMAQDQTRADLVAQRLMAFHFFQSRQLWFLTNQMANHPFLINMYFNAVEELEKLAEQEGYPEYLTGWLQVLTGPGGRLMYLNPFALLQSYMLFDQNNSFRYDRDGNNRNKIEGWIKDHTGLDIDLDMIGLNPSLDNIINLVGWKGDTWAPDMTGYGRDSMILTLINNTGRVYGLWGDGPAPRGNWLDDEMRKYRESVSGFNPWADQVEARDSEQSMDREIDAIMFDELAKEGVDPESEEAQRLVAEAKLDPDSDLYQRSLKRWIHGEWFEVGTRAVAGPLRPRYRLGDKDGNDLMLNLGENAKRTVNTPEPMVVLFRQQQDAYYEIGDTRTQRLNTIWNDIANGEVSGDLTVNGVTYTEAEIKAMDRSQRVALANGLMADYGVMGDINTLRDDRSKFLAQPENREVAQFQTWRSAVYDYEGGPEQYWQDLIKGNPTAKAYYDSWLSTIDDPGQRHRAMTSNNAFFAIKGWDTYVFDKPYSVKYNSPNEIWDPVGVANTQAQPIPYEEYDPSGFKSEVRQAPVFLHDMQVYDRHVQEKMAAWGYPPGTSFRSLPTKQRIAIEDALEADGIYEPKPSWQIQQYLEWIDKQPPGSLDGMSEQEIMERFFAEGDREYYEKMPTQTQDNISKPQPIPSPDIYGNTPQSGGGTFWQDLFSLLNEYDHRKYNDPWGSP